MLPKPDFFGRRYRRRDLAIVTSLERVKAVTRGDHVATLSDRMRRYHLLQTVYLQEPSMQDAGRVFQFLSVGGVAVATNHLRLFLLQALVIGEETYLHVCICATDSVFNIARTIHLYAYQSSSQGTC